MFAFEDARLRTEVCGLRFRNPIGIAAGYDKNAACVPGLSALGAGHVEVGTLTPLAQRGNARPRVFRLAQDAALINRLGFPNAGIVAALPRLAALRARGHAAPLGINIGKGRDTPLELALEDYSTLLQQVHPFADYIAINISSPNTPGLRTLQSSAALAPLLGALEQLRRQHCPRLPLFVKIAPDLSPAQLDELLDAALANDIAGVIATNTTTARPNLRSPAAGAEGGLSGVPLQPASTAAIRHIRKYSGNQLAIIMPAALIARSGAGKIECRSQSTAGIHWSRVPRSGLVASHQPRPGANARAARGALAGRAGGRVMKNWRPTMCSKVTNLAVIISFDRTQICGGGEWLRAKTG